MATTKTTEERFNGNGSKTDFLFTIEYLLTSDLRVFVNNVLQTETTHYSIQDNKLIFVTAPTSGTRNIKLTRSTNIDKARAFYQAGSSIKAKDLTENQDQVLFALQEKLNTVNTVVGNTAPSNPVNGDRWFDTVSGRTYVYYEDADSIQWVEASPPYEDTNAPQITSVSNAQVAGNAAIDATKLSFTRTDTGAVVRTVTSKLQDIVSPKDFGAVGDGVADDTAALQSAINLFLNNNGGIDNDDPQGRVVDLGGGIYKITDTLQASNANGLVIQNGTIIAADPSGGTWSDGSGGFKPMIFSNPSWHFHLYNLTIECNDKCNGLHLNRQIWGRLQNVAVHGFGYKQYGYKSDQEFKGLNLYISDSRFAGPIAAEAGSSLTPNPYVPTATALILSEAKDSSIHNCETIRVACGIDLKGGGWSIADCHFTGTAAGAPGVKLQTTGDTNDDGSYEGTILNRITDNYFDQSNIEVFDHVNRLNVSNNVFLFNTTTDMTDCAIKWTTTIANHDRKMLRIVNNMAHIKATTPANLRFIKDVKSGSGTFANFADCVIKNNTIVNDPDASDTAEYGGITATEGMVKVNIDMTKADNRTVSIPLPGLLFQGSLGSPLPPLTVNCSVGPVLGAEYNTNSETLFLCLDNTTFVGDALLDFKCGIDQIRSSNNMESANNFDNWATSSGAQTAGQNDPFGGTAAIKFKSDNPSATEEKWLTAMSTGSTAGILKHTATPLNLETSVCLKKGAGFNSAIATSGFTLSTNVIEKTGHGLSVNDQLKYTSNGTNITKNPNTPIPDGTILYVRTVPNENTFTLSETQGGTELDLDGAGNNAQTFEQVNASPITRARVRWRGETNERADVYVDLTNGTIFGGAVTGTNMPEIETKTTVVPMGNDWYNIMTKSTTDAHTHFVFQIFPMEGNSASYQSENIIDHIFVFNPVIKGTFN